MCCQEIKKFRRMGTVTNICICLCYVFVWQCLCVLMSLLHLVAEEAEQSLMDASNLAVVMAPSLMETEATDYQNVNCSLRLQKGG